MNIQRFRRDLTETPLQPYDVIADGDRWSKKTAKQADSVISDKWRLGSLPAVKISVPVEWDVITAENRSHHFFLHCWDFLSPVLATYDRRGGKQYLDFAVSVAADWAQQFSSVETASPFAWYDMAVGLRAYRLAYILDVAARNSDMNDERIEELLVSVLLHAEVLADEKRFAGHSNHGIYVAAGQLAMARRLHNLPGMADRAEQARARLFTMMHAHITGEGMHREHSPDYHRQVLEAFDGLFRAGLLGGELERCLFDKLEEALAWLILPNGRLAMFGDTNWRLMTSRQSRYSNPVLRFATSGGREGSPPIEHIRGFPESGYFIARDRWPAGPADYEKCSYLAQTCAFHSRVHKHADDLSFVWYDRGAEILVDPGKYGYLGRTKPDSALFADGFWYDDPNRVYVESTTAHNTVEIDDRNFRRRGVSPYGSALHHWGEHDGVSFSNSSVNHWEHIHHERLLLFHPGEWLIVCDRLVDSEHHCHRYRQRFHFAPELDLQTVNNQLEIVLPGTRAKLFAASFTGDIPDSPLKGQLEPAMLGWIAREDHTMQPCFTTSYAAENDAHLFVTLFAFGDDPPRDLALQTAPGDPSRPQELSWRQDQRLHTLAIVWNPKSEPEICYAARFFD